MMEQENDREWRSRLFTVNRVSSLLVRLSAIVTAALFSHCVGDWALVAQDSEISTSLVFREVDVFDGSQIIRHTNVLVRNGMIVGVDENLEIPASAEIVDGKDKTLLPGLIDAHTHLGVAQAEGFLEDALRFGVTTELEMWGSEKTFSLRKKARELEPLKLADFRTAGIGVTAPNGHPTQMGGPAIPTLAPESDAQEFVDARIAEGSEYIKKIYESAYPTLTKQQIADVVAAAHRRNKIVVVHISKQSEGVDAILAGVDGLVHIFAESPPEPGFVQLASEHDVFVIPTLSVLESVTSSSTDRQWWQGDQRVLPFITPSMKASLDMKFPPNFSTGKKLEHAMNAVEALRKAGVIVLAGTDAPGPGLAHGLSIHRELELLVACGFTPTEALAAATSKTADAFDFHDRGRIVVGKRADIVLVTGDPTADITKTRDIVGVWKLGKRQTRQTTALPSKE